MVSPEELAGPDRARRLFGAEVVDVDGNRVGTVTEVFLDDDTDRPTWVSIRTGWFGTNESLVPLQGAEISGDRIRVHYGKATIKAAPRSDDGQPLSRDDEGELYRYYHRESGGRDAAAADPAEDAAIDGTGERLAGDRDIRDGGMMRSEEQLAVGAERVATGRASLRKYLVTEEQQITVSVSREDVRVEYVTELDPAASGVDVQGLSAPAERGARSQGAPDGDTDGIAPGVPDGIADRGAVRQDDRTAGGDATPRTGGWMVLYAQRPVVTMEWVPVERVRLGTVEVTAEETVTGEVRKEQLDVVTDEPSDGTADNAADDAVPQRAAR